MKTPARLLCLSACMATAVFMGGCASYYYGDSAGGARASGGAMRTSVIAANHHAADMLVQDAPLDRTQPVLVATLVNVDRLGESSRLGRIFSEQIAGRLVQRGLPVAELKLRDNVAMQRDQGELLLSRELRDVSRAHDAQAVVVGTYAVSASILYVSIKLVRPEGNVVVGAHNYAVPMDDNVRALLAGR
ncbi:FlgO family outer membrane protein [Acidovorax sp.]|uniref:FlgO family outer membrane protein n=1 Tax=Acidovorax sp. TaxID=1872122 RepID=UPI000AD3643E|nr:FlgO family outer membrane protein [Acidovorax sp.]MDH4462472.1 FlgO family outer membrane protein [Acidovorax sp.]